MKTTPQSGNLGYFIFMSQKKKKNVSRQCLPYLHISDAKQAFEADPESAVLNFLGFLKRTGCWCRVQTFFIFCVVMKGNRNCEGWGRGRSLTVQPAKWRCWWKSNVSICSTALVSMAAGRLRADVKRAALALRGPLQGAAINLTGQQRPDWGGCVMI